MSVPQKEVKVTNRQEYSQQNLALTLLCSFDQIVTFLHAWDFQDARRVRVSFVGGARASECARPNS